MMVLSLAPATGKIVADLLEKKEQDIDLRLLEPDRFG
jgi:glycine/D-amino acid oxidase-like deaminating enzyme